MSLSEMISGSAIAAVISDPRLPDNPIVECNEAFTALTGYPREEIVGRNCRFLAGPGTDPAATEALRQGIAAGRPVMVEILNYKKDGTPFRNAVLVAPIFEADGSLRYFLGSQVEIDERQRGRFGGAEAARRVAALSPRQKTVLAAMATGRMNKQIAHELGLAERTVKMHRTGLVRALGVRSAAEAIRLAIEAGY